MKINIETKFNIGDDVFALRPKLDIRGYEDMLCKRTGLQHKYKPYPLKIVSVGHEISELSGNGNYAFTFYNLLEPEIKGETGYPKFYDKVREEDVFETYEEAHDELGKRVEGFRDSLIDAN